jgi:hypothetical protein
MPNVRILILTAAAIFAGAIPSTSGAEPSVSVRANFPGGNVVVVRNEGPQVELAPDLRGGDPWFYWYFEATAVRAGTATFTFAGSPRIGVNGPAVSADGGKSWRWLGSEAVHFADTTVPPAKRSESFDYTFTADRRPIRFAVGIPYLPSDLEAFLNTLEGNAHLRRSILTKTRQGTPVDLLEIGGGGEGRRTMLVTARHHACEAMASYVLEGFVREAVSNLPAGRAFREKYRLFVVPMVDKDGVAAGDQGKNRSPHDHNRDYGEAPFYPEVAAIQQLAGTQNVRYFLDLHCPALRGDVHEVFHFLGLGLPRVKNNVDEFIGRIREERPQSVNSPLNFMVDSKKPGAINRRIGSHFFATTEGNVVAATLEIPYAVPGNSFDAETARAYGAALLRAWTATVFVPDETTVRDAWETCSKLVELRTEFARSFRGKPDLMLKHIGELPQNEPYLVEADILRASLFLHQKQYEAAERECDEAAAREESTTFQKVATRLTRLRIAAADPQSTDDRVSRRLDEFLAVPYLARDQQAQGLAVAGDYFAMRHQNEKAIDLAKRQLKVAASYDQGKLWLRVAALLESSGKPAEGVAARRTAVDVLHKQLSPQPPRSGMGGAMTVDLFDALCGLSSATLDEKRAAARLVFEHDVVSETTKERVRRTLAGLEMP